MQEELYRIKELVELKHEMEIKVLKDLKDFGEADLGVRQDINSLKNLNQKIIRLQFDFIHKAEIEKRKQNLRIEN